uniref:YqaJ viral recombinase domain-containing protein n=1 Tax=viral metagenome TaxID=1070528 RepID=A0A6C0D6K6_9ZZZZ
MSVCTSESDNQHFDEPLIDTFSESEIMDIEENILESIHEYFETNLVEYSSPNFFKNLKTDISEPLLEEWVNFGLCTDDDGDEIEMMVQTQLEKYMEEIRCGIPPRQTTFSNCGDSSANHTIAQKIGRLLSISQPEQRSKEWYEQRNNMITASNIYKLLGSKAQYNSLIYEKCKPVAESHSTYVNTESSLHWGVKYEPVTKMIYEKMYCVDITEFGCIPHPTYPFIGASPDGIITDSRHSRYGHMVEIKNIVNREIDGIPKEEYWVQMQIQMENCDLDYCDFVETRIKEYASEEEAMNDTDREYKGILLHFIRKMLVANSDETYDGSPFYVYMPLDVEFSKTAVDEWILTKRNEYREDFVLFKSIYWYLDEISCVLVPRNRPWFETALPVFAKAWETIQFERVNGYEHRASNKKKKVVVDLNGDVHTIQNMPIGSGKGICLIKMDY